jgi:hypothetical protein
MFEQHQPPVVCFTLSQRKERQNMKLKLAFTLLMFLVWIVGSYSSTASEWVGGARVSASSSASAGFAPQGFPTPPTKITSALATIPQDFVGIPSQGNIDLFSWLSFVAINWPANTAVCGANTNASILDCKTSVNCAPSVWETYLTDSEVFVASGSTPAPWCAQTQARLARLPSNVQSMAKKAGVTRVFMKQNKASGLKQSFPGIDEAFGGPLTDQNGRFVRYEIHLNKDEYQYILDPTKTGNKSINLWSVSGQKNFGSLSNVQFPLGNSQTKVTGSMEIKAAWKVLSPAEVSSNRFYAIQALVFNDDFNPPGASVPPNVPVTLGLVGLHIVHKTSRQPHWIWSTFEHVDNLTKSFYNPNCPSCPTNQPASPYSTDKNGNNHYKELNPNGNPITKPVQVVRINPIQSPPTQANAAFQALLAGSVWANYQLISSQWMDDLAKPEPGFLANMTLETFNQGPNPPSDGLPNGATYNPLKPDPRYQPFQAGVSSSCIKCHSLGNDFSFLLGSAQ